VRGGDACEESFVATDADADAARGGCFKHRGGPNGRWQLGPPALSDS
jgi:hypothetical protein